MTNSDLTELDSTTRRKLMYGLGAIGASGLAGCMGDGSEDTGTTNDGGEDTGTTNGGGDESGGSGDGGDSGQTATAWRWNMPAVWDGHLEENSSQFEEQSDISLNWTAFPHGNYPSKYTSAVTGGNPPDIAAMSTRWIPRFGDTGNLEDVGSIGLDPDALIDGARGNASYDGTLYAACYYTDCRLIHINIDMFEEAGLEVPPKTDFVPTWDDFAKWVDALNTDDHKAYAFNAGRAFHAWMMSNGTMYLNEDGTETNFDSDAAIETVEYLYDTVIEPEAGIAITNQSFPDSLAEFVSETAAMKYGGPWEYPRIRENDINFMSVPVPVGPNGDTPHTFAGGVYFSIPPEVQNQDAAKQYLEYIGWGEEVQNNMIKNGAFPGLASAYESETFNNYVEENPVIQTAAQEMPNTVPFPSHPKLSEMLTNARQAVQAVYSGEDARPTFEQTAQEINSIL